MTNLDKIIENDLKYNQMFPIRSKIVEKKNCNLLLADVQCDKFFVVNYLILKY